MKHTAVLLSGNFCSVFFCFLRLSFEHTKTHTIRDETLKCIKTLNKKAPPPLIFVFSNFYATHKKRNVKCIFFSRGE